MPLADLSDWMDEHTGPGIVWFVKRLSGNDTLATGAHQAGPYIPKEFLFDMFPCIHAEGEENPRTWVQLRIDSHGGDARDVCVIWYNNRLRGGTRNEARMTNFGGASSALLDPESTGALTIFAFHRGPNGEANVCHVWICDFEVEADLVEDRIGPVEPGGWLVWTVDEGERVTLPAAPPRANCWLSADEIPGEWLDRFPSGADIIRRTVELRPAHGIAIDTRLMRRRTCEYEIFRSVEEAVELPHLRGGFASVEDFIARAHRILQRRKSRSGRSLELHARQIFLEEELVEGRHFQHQPESDINKKPDFLFPSETAYKDPGFPAHRLRMLAAKTTCKDRWRQVINEADRIPVKHLLTLQEGVSTRQFQEMRQAGVQLVVPEPLFRSYPDEVRPHLQTLESFVADIRLLSLQTD